MAGVVWVDFPSSFLTFLSLIFHSFGLVWYSNLTIFLISHFFPIPFFFIFAFLSYSPFPLFPFSFVYFLYFYFVSSLLLSCFFPFIFFRFLFNAFFYLSTLSRLSCSRSLLFSFFLNILWCFNHLDWLGFSHGGTRRPMFQSLFSIISIPRAWDGLHVSVWARVLNDL